MPGSPASIHHVRKHGGRRDLQEMNVIPMCPHHHAELHANRRNYGALYGIGNRLSPDEMRTRFMPMLRQSTESRLHGRLSAMPGSLDCQTAGALRERELQGCQSCATQHAPSTEQTCGNCAESTPLNRTWIR